MLTRAIRSLHSQQFNVACVADKPVSPVLLFVFHVANDDSLWIPPDVETILFDGCKAFFISGLRLLATSDGRSVTQQN
jgi:hypothetical protein